MKHPVKVNYFAHPVAFLARLRLQRDLFQFGGEYSPLCLQHLDRPSRPLDLSLDLEQHVVGGALGGEPRRQTFLQRFKLLFQLGPVE